MRQYLLREAARAHSQTTTIIISIQQRTECVPYDAFFLLIYNLAAGQTERAAGQRNNKTGGPKELENKHCTQIFLPVAVLTHLAV